MPTRKPTTYSCQRVSASATYAIGIDASNAARPKSPAIRIGRRGSRSTHTPAGSVKRMKGRNSIVPSAATSKALASSTRMATSGSASCETCVPNWLIVSADQSLRKSRWHQSPPCGHVGLRIVASSREGGIRGVERRGESVRLPVRMVGRLDCREETIHAQPQATRVLGQESGVREPGRDACCGKLGGKDLLGGLPKHHSCQRRLPDHAFVRLVRLEDEEPCDATVVLLRHRADLPRRDDADEPGAFQHLHVVPGGSFRDPQRL